MTQTICPVCATHINLLEEKVKEQEGVILDCPACLSVLTIRDTRLVEFHSYLTKETDG